jgi:hypothetical protein
MYLTCFFHVVRSIGIRQCKYIFFHSMDTATIRRLSRALRVSYDSHDILSCFEETRMARAAGRGLITNLSHGKCASNWKAENDDLGARVPCLHALAHQSHVISWFRLGDSPSYLHRAQTAWIFRARSYHSSHRSSVVALPAPTCKICSRVAVTHEVSARTLTAYCHPNNRKPTASPSDAYAYPNAYIARFTGTASNPCPLVASASGSKSGTAQASLSDVTDADAAENRERAREGGSETATAWPGPERVPVLAGTVTGTSTGTNSVAAQGYCTPYPWTTNAYGQAPQVKAAHNATACATWMVYILYGGSSTTDNADKFLTVTHKYRRRPAEYMGSSRLARVKEARHSDESITFKDAPACVPCRPAEKRGLALVYPPL